MTETSDRFTRANADLVRPGRRTVPLRRDEALALLREHADEIANRTGIRPIGLFGSVARDDARVDSDADVLVQFVRRPIGWTELADAETYLDQLLGVRADVVTWDELKPRVQAYVERDLIRVA